MSGIAGIIHFDGRPAERARIEQMTDAMAHRGLDGINHFVRDSVALGQCMLRTTPESLEETQPLTNEDESLVLVMDGRVDNWEELRRELLFKGARLRTRADAELVLRAYETWGEQCVSHIDGEFAFVIWDAHRREVFCARDRMGLKPLYYHWDGKMLIFASELAPILGIPSVPQVPNEGAIAEYLAAELHTRDETLWTGVMRLVAAHQMRVTKGGPRIEFYWFPKLDAPLCYKRDEEYFEHYRELFADCVRRTSRSHRPAAYEVSGGLNSSAVFCMAHRLSCNGRLPAPGIEGYTFSVAGDKLADEFEFARTVGRHLGRIVYEVPPFIPPLDWFAAHARASRDFPGFPSAVMSVALYRNMAAGGQRISVGGDGGDEWLTGSKLYYAEYLQKMQLTQILNCFREDLSACGYSEAFNALIREGIIAALPHKTQERVRRAVRRLRKVCVQGSASQLADTLYWLSTEMRDRLADQRHFAETASQFGRISAVHRYQLTLLHSAYFDRTFEHAERLASSCGVERRSPMRDHRFVQFAFSTPERLRLQCNTTKFIHRKALQDLLPNAIATRVDKAEFSIVFRRQLDHLEKELKGEIAAERKTWLRAAGVAQLYDLFVKERVCSWPMWILWAIIGCHFAVGGLASTDGNEERIQ